MLKSSATAGSHRKHGRQPRHLWPFCIGRQKKGMVPISPMDPELWPCLESAAYGQNWEKHQRGGKRKKN